VVPVALSVLTLTPPAPTEHEPRAPQFVELVDGSMHVGTLFAPSLQMISLPWHSSWHLPLPLHTHPVPKPVDGVAPQVYPAKSVVV
jgi:hypothetical protein